MVRTRFAPSPTGYLHIGGLRTALYAYLFAKKNGGRFILRIEDTDQERLVPGATDMILRTMKETGLFYDEGPDVGGEYGPYVQSLRMETGWYKKYADELVKSGAAYVCFCTVERLESLRREYEEKGETFKYDKTCLKLPPDEVRKRIESGEKYVIRQNVPKDGEISFDDMVFGKVTVNCSELDDTVLLKSDGMPTYNFANVVDDHMMGITHIMRGTEYLSSTPKYNLLYKSLGWDIPEYIHMPPVMKEAGVKLSKRHGDASFEDYIKKGYMKEAILNYIALLGWSPGGTQEIFSLKELEELFDIRGINKSPAIFDVNKLTWMNAQYIRALSEDEFIKAAAPYFDKVLPKGRFDLEIITRILQPRLETLAEIPDKLRYLVEFKEYDTGLFVHKKMKTDKELALKLIKEAYDVLLAEGDWSEGTLHDALMALAEKLGVKTGQLLYSVRLSVTGVAVTPGGAIEIAALLGKEETLRRMEFSIGLLRP